MGVVVWVVATVLGVFRRGVWVYGLWILLAGERIFVEVLDELFKDTSSPELSVVRVSEFVEGVLLILIPRVLRKFMRDLWGVRA